MDQLEHCLASPRSVRILRQVGFHQHALAVLPAQLLIHQQRRQDRVVAGVGRPAGGRVRHDQSRRVSGVAPGGRRFPSILADGQAGRRLHLFAGPAYTNARPNQEVKPCFSHLQPAQDFPRKGVIGYIHDMPSYFLDVDPRELRVPPSRPTGADPVKLHRQIARFGASSAGTPPLIVYEGTHGVLVI